jgi:hypothetical protein
MNTSKLLKTLKKSGKRVCLSHLYRLFSILDIKPIGRSRPQNYPDDSAERILNHFGISAAVNGQHVKADDATSQRPAGKLITVAQIRAAKPSKRKVTV